MRTAGIDLGSRSIKLVIVENGAILESRRADTGYDPIQEAQKLLDGIRFDRIMATGYGRGLFEIAHDAPTVTEIKAHALGVRHFFPTARNVLDIGGQDSQAIALSPTGKEIKFEMNDRCAAGTGKFLEVMARSLGFSVETFGAHAMQATRDLPVSSMCTVFAESEVTSLVARGEDRQEIALGLHRSIVQRAIGMLRRVAADGPLVFSGGVAKNPCINALLAEKLGCDILVPQDPQLTGALGAALLAGQ